MKKDLTTHLAMVTYYGVPMPKCPATTEELRAGGSAIIEHNPNYIEDETPFNPFQKATLVVKDNHIQVIGPTGSGKDEWGRQMAAKTGRPIALFNFNDDGDQSGWVTRTTLEKEDGTTVTKEVEGSLRRACQGLTIYRRLKNVLPDVETDADVEALVAEMKSHDWVAEHITEDVYKLTLPFIVQIQDADRAGEKLEPLRQACELNKEMLTDPITGESFPVLRGTRFIFTGNSGVDGDGGRGMVVKQKDASMANRMSAIRVSHPSEEVEKQVYSREYPQLSQHEVAMVVKCTNALREVCRQEHLALDVSMRQGLAWISHAVRFQEFYGCKFIKALKESLDALTGHFMEDENAELFKAAVSTFLVEANKAQPQTSNPSPSSCPIDNI